MQSTERNDLRNPISTIFLLNINNDLIALLLAEVDVKIRHGHTLGIEEALKQQAKCKGIKIGNGQRISDKRTRTRSSTGANGNIIILGPFNKVGNDQEVTGKSHAVDDVDLVFEACVINASFRYGRAFEKACFKASSRLGCQFLWLITACSGGKAGQNGRAGHGANGATPGNIDAVLKCLR